MQAVASGVLGCSRFRGRRRCGSWPARTRAGHPQCSACSTGRPRGRQPSQAPGQHSSLRRPSCLHAPAPAHCQQQMCQQPDPPLSPPPQQLWAQLLQARSRERTSVVDLTESQMEPMQSERKTVEHSTASAMESRKHEARGCVGRTRAAPDSQKALRVQSLRQELAAAEGVVSELRAWLADAEAELEAQDQ